MTLRFHTLDFTCKDLNFATSLGLDRRWHKQFDAKDGKQLIYLLQISF